MYTTPYQHTHTHTHRQYCICHINDTLAKINSRVWKTSADPLTHTNIHTQVWHSYLTPRLWSPHALLALFCWQYVMFALGNNREAECSRMAIAYLLEILTRQCRCHGNVQPHASNIFQGTTVLSLQLQTKCNMQNVCLFTCLASHLSEQTDASCSVAQS